MLLDYEDTQSISLLLEARDTSSSNQLQGSTRVLVMVVDENDNYPLFEGGVSCNVELLERSF